MNDPLGHDHVASLQEIAGVLSEREARNETLRTQQIPLVQTALLNGASVVEAAAAAGVSRARFYKAGLAATRAAEEPDPSEKDRALAELRDLSAQREALASEISELVEKRADLIRGAARPGNHREVAAAAGVSDEWVRMLSKNRG